MKIFQHSSLTFLMSLLFSLFFYATVKAQTSGAGLLTSSRKIVIESVSTYTRDKSGTVEQAVPGKNSSTVNTSLKASNKTYVSANSGNFGNGNSWVGGKSPKGKNADVVISAGDVITLTGTEQVSDLTVSAGATLKLAGHKLKVKGDVVINGSLDSSGTIVFNGNNAQSIIGKEVFYGSIEIDNNNGVSIVSGKHCLTGALILLNGNFNTNSSLTLVSNAQGTARVDKVIAGSVTGDVTVERYIDMGAANWRFLSSPVSTATLTSWNDDFVMSGFPGSAYPSYPFVSIYTYDETAAGNKSNGYLTPSGINDTLTPGKGFWVWNSSKTGANTPFTVDVKGTLNIGPVNLPVTYTNDPAQPASEDGWNLVGNPYASTIDWDATGWTKNNINNAIYIWDPKIQQYATYAGGVGTNGGSRYIASSQAFWVQTKGAAPVLMATENIKVNAAASFIRQERPEENIDQDQRHRTEGPDGDSFYGISHRLFRYGSRCAQDLFLLQIRPLRVYTAEWRRSGYQRHSFPRP